MTTVQTVAPKSTEILKPTKVTGYKAYARSPYGAWQEVHSVEPNMPSHPVLPFGWKETKEEAIRGAANHLFKDVLTIKVLEVEFEVNP
jgi:hypothetical protein